MLETFFKHPLDLKDAYALHIVGRLDRGYLMETVNFVLNNGTFTESLNALFFGEDLPYEELTPLFEKVCREFDVTPFSQKDAAFHIARILFARGIAGEVRLEKVVKYLYNISFQLSPSPEEDMGKYLDIERIYGAHVLLDDTIGNRFLNEAAAYAQLRKTVVAWLEKHTAK
ncbi:hypothetical protein [Kordiimonas gwangyangensis]|uniref:hypothetical protein n=1 Tax=Kordiimonas gwangyangensis TaxID=288022 RepID=UPI00036149C9|nr:hypothetical protein [Kordiimonas gwangyangensis]